MRGERERGGIKEEEGEERSKQRGNWNIGTGCFLFESSEREGN